MSEPIEQVAERVLALDAEATKGPLAIAGGNDDDDFPIPPQAPHWHLYSLHGGRTVAFLPIRGSDLQGGDSPDAVALADYLNSAPALAREVLALRKLCGVMQAALDRYASHDGACHWEEDMEYGDRQATRNPRPCSCGLDAAVSAIDATLNAPAVKPEGPKG